MISSKFPYKVLFPLTKDDCYYKYFSAKKEDEKSERKFIVLSVQMNKCSPLALISLLKKIALFAPQFADPLRTICTKKKIQLALTSNNPELKLAPKVLDLAINSEQLSLALPDYQLMDIGRFRGNLRLGLQLVFSIYRHYTSVLRLCQSSRTQQQFDLSISNLQEEDSRVVLLDFGLDVNQAAKHPLHWAPEIATGNYCPQVSESWSFGVLMLGVLIGHQHLYPLKLMKNDGSNQNIIKNFLQQLCQKNGLPSNIAELANDLLQVSTSSRIEWNKIEDRLAVCLQPNRDHYRGTNNNHHHKLTPSVKLLPSNNKEQLKDIQINRKTEFPAQKNYYFRMQQKQQDENIRDKSQTISQESHRRKIIQSLSQKHNKSINLGEENGRQSSLDKSSTHYDYAMVAVRQNIQSKNRKYTHTDSSYDISQQRPLEQYSIQKSYHNHLRSQSQQKKKGLDLNESSIKYEATVSSSKQYQFSDSKNPFEEIEQVPNKKRIESNNNPYSQSKHTSFQLGSLELNPKGSHQQIGYNLVSSKQRRPQQNSVPSLYQPSETLRTIEDFSEAKEEVIKKPSPRQNTLPTDLKFKRPQQQLVSARKMQDALETIQLEEEDDKQKQLRKQANVEEFRKELRNLEESYEYINLVGETIGKCVEYLDAYENVWIVPLSLIFKRMYQMRQNLMKDVQTSRKEGFLRWEEFVSFADKVRAENETVKDEVEEIIKLSLSKLDGLDQEGRQKMSSLLNLDLNCDIKDIVFVYLYSQVLARVKQIVKSVRKSTSDNSKKKKQKIHDFSETQWVQLQLSIQFSLIVFERYPFENLELTRVELENYKQFVGGNLSPEAGQRKYEENERVLEGVRKRLQLLGYQV